MLTFLAQIRSKLQPKGKLKEKMEKTKNQKNSKKTLTTTALVNVDASLEVNFINPLNPGNFWSRQQQNM
jgi:hypothetical protein